MNLLNPNKFKNCKCYVEMTVSLFIYFKQFTLAIVILGDFER